MMQHLSLMSSTLRALRMRSATRANLEDEGYSWMEVRGKKKKKNGGCSRGMRRLLDGRARKNTRARARAYTHTHPHPHTPTPQVESLSQHHHLVSIIPRPRRVYQVRRVLFVRVPDKHVTLSRAILSPLTHPRRRCGGEGGQALQGWGGGGSNIAKSRTPICLLNFAKW